MALIKEKLVKSFIIILNCLKLAECDCGIPSAAEGVAYLPKQLKSKLSYEESTKLCGYCMNDTHLLVSTDAAQKFSTLDGKKCVEIVCKHGSWTGSLPRCAIPLSRVDSDGESNDEPMFNEISYYKGFLDLSDFLERNLPEKIGSISFDKGSPTKESNCVYRSGTEQYEFNHTWIFDLKHNSTVAYILLNLETKRQLKELSLTTFASAFINEIRDCKVHHIEEIDQNILKMGLMCDLDDPESYDSNEDTVDSVLLAINAQRGVLIKSACLLDFPKSCGTNEIPVDDRGFATPRCLADGVWDTLIPEPLSYCNLPVNDTYLHGNTFILGDGEVVQYVNAKYYNQTLFAVPYTIEIHSCEDQVVGTRMCTEQGDWDNDELSCSDSASITLPPSFLLIAISNILIKWSTN